jgi:hypothetical protein
MALVPPATKSGQLKQQSFLGHIRRHLRVLIFVILRLFIFKTSHVQSTAVRGDHAIPDQ